jgi:IS30 family transposase
MKYRQITLEERYNLSLLRRQGYTAAAIARILGRHRSTILREVRRNRKVCDGGYRPQLADWYARGRRSRSRRNQRFSKTDLCRVTKLLRKKWSPEQIAGYLRRHGILQISHESIYRYIWADNGKAETCIRTSVELQNNDANGTEATIAVDAWPANDTSPQGPLPSRPENRSDTGKSTPS